MTDMFTDMDPWERLIYLDSRVETLEKINNEIILHLQLTSRHCEDMSKAITQLQREQISLIAQLNTRGEKL